MATGVEYLGAVCGAGFVDSTASESRGEYWPARRDVADYRRDSWLAGVA